MLDQDACERRVYRLAMLLTGDPVVATRVTEAVVGVRADLRGLDDAHLDRLTVLRARELSGDAGDAGDAGAAGDAGDAKGQARGRRLPDDAAVPRAVSAALAALAPQEREIWVFRHVYRMSVREAARAMDCSSTAAARHIERAETSMRAALGDATPEAGETLLRYSLALDVPEIYRARRRRAKRRRRLRVAWTATLVVVAAGLVVAWWRILASA